MSRQRSSRMRKIDEVLREILAEEIGLLKDPRIGFVTITGVEVTPDGQHATVRVSVLGADDDKALALEGLDHARGFLRSYLAARLELRITPDLRFELDRGLEHARRIDALLEQVRKEGDST